MKSIKSISQCEKNSSTSHNLHDEKNKKYQCKICNYNTSYKSNLYKHFQTIKHLSLARKASQKVSNTTFISNNFKNEQKYECELCDYKTSKISNWKRHISSVSHAARSGSLGSQNEPKSITDDNIVIYDSKPQSIVPFSNNDEYQPTHEDYIILKTKANRVDKLEKMVESLLDQNNKLTESIRNTMESQNKVICDMAKQPRIVQNNNNSFNLMNYLNNDCKDAPNLTDFINGLKVDYDDLLKIRDNGYIYGMERNLINELIRLEQNKRPIQCTDIKRKRFVVKDDETWGIDNDNQRLNQALNDITTKHIKELQAWKLRNPDWMDNDSKFDMITDITCQILKGSSNNGVKLKNKIFEKLSHAVKVKK